MKAILFTFVLLANLTLLLVPVEARAVHAWTTDQLKTRSVLICEGVVLSIKQTGSTHEYEYEYGGMKCPEVIMAAKIKVVHILKGRAEAEIEVLCRATQPPTVTRQNDEVTTSVTHFIADGPQHIRIAPNMKFHFFLIPAPDRRGYVSVMDGDPDDAQSVSPAG